MDPTPLLLNSITDADAVARGRVVVSGSHGGVYPAAIASRARVHAVLFNDAGIGFDQAGIAGVRALEACGMAAAAVACLTAEIGSATDALAHGVISFANDQARAVGVVAGMAARDAAALLVQAPAPVARLAPGTEARWDRDRPGKAALLCLDSASLVTPGDAGRIIITGSHGGLIGGDPARALKAKALLAVFNDAGGGKNGIGTSRLPALQQQGIAAITVSHDSCRIGDAASALAEGVISAANPCAQAMQARVQDRLADFLNLI
ncbi:MAG: hypothetical protein ACI8R4_002289 [Paracoccaceae bacterium]|jgi:hypothetical protein